MLVGDKRLTPSVQPAVRCDPILSENEISQIVRDNFDLRPKNLINLLDLKRPIYKNTASYGHFGREIEDFSWENTDISNQIK